MNLPQTPQVFWQRLVTKPFFPQYFLNILHFFDVSSHAVGSSGFLVVSGYPVAETIFKQDEI